MKEHDVVLLKDGREVTILCVFEGGEAFMIEVSDEKGRAIDTPIVEAKDIKEITWEY